MPVPSRKRNSKRPAPAKPDKARTPEAAQEDADLRAFRAMRKVSRRATAIELDELIRPEE
jgi:hypothetical protein